MKKTNEEFYKPFEITDDQVKEFELTLGRYKANADMKKPLDFYGTPVKQIEGLSSVDGFILNPIIGGTHWAIVQYCLENKIIGRRDDGSWFVVAEYKENFVSGACRTEAYDLFINKWRALDKLRSRRQYAKDKQDEAFGGGFKARIEEVMRKTKESLMANVFNK